MIDKKTNRFSVRLLSAALLAVTATAYIPTAVSANEIGSAPVETERIETLNAHETYDETAAIINQNLDTMVNGIVYHSEEGYFKAHPNELNEILALGDAALPYLTEIGEKYAEYGKYTQEQTRCFLAMAAAYRISPDTYDVVSVSPDGNLELRAKVTTFFTLADESRGIEYKGVTITQKSTGKILHSGPVIDGNVYNKAIYNLDPIWSPDSRYAVYHLDTGLSDRSVVCVSIKQNAKNGSVVYWPHSELYFEMKGKLRQTMELVGIDTSVREWKTNKTAIVDVTIKYTSEGETRLIAGSYIYNIPSRRYRNVTFEAPVNIGPDIGEVVNKNLDILIMDTATNSYTAEKQFIDAHPEAFDSIVSLGKDALPFLKKVIERYPLTYGCASYLGGYGRDYKRTVMATAAAYEIDPDAYDLVFEAPDKVYHLRASIDSFYGIGDPFKGIKYTVSLVDSITGDTLTSRSGYSNLMTVNWSPDSRYAAVTERLDSTLVGSPVTVYDTDTGKVVALPYSAIRQEILNSGGWKKTFGFDIGFDSWMQDGKMLVSITAYVGNDAVAGLCSGYMVYDLASGKITEKNYNFTAN